MWVFLAHGVFLRSLPLELRSQAEASCHLPTKHILDLTAFGLCLANELTTQPPVDGRIFGLLLAKLIQPNAVSVKVLGPETYKRPRPFGPPSPRMRSIFLSLKHSPPALQALRRLLHRSLTIFLCIHSTTRSSTKRSSWSLLVLARVPRSTPSHLHYSSLVDARSSLRPGDDARKKRSHLSTSVVTMTIQRTGGRGSEC